MKPPIVSCLTLACSALLCGSLAASAGEVTVLTTDSFEGAAGAPLNANSFEWSGEVYTTGSGQATLGTWAVGQSWFRSKAGAALTPGQTLNLTFHAYAYCEGNTIYGNGQPRGLRVGTDGANVVEFFSASGSTLGLRVRKDGAESVLYHPFPVRVDSMHLYEISVTTTSAVFRVNGLTVGTFDNPPAGALNFYVGTSDGGAGNVPATLDDMLLSLTRADFPAPIAITSFPGNGQLTWTNAPSLMGAWFGIEWAAAPGTNWHSSWGVLSSMMATGLTTTVEVPMLYRVRAITNALIPGPLNGQLSFAVSNMTGSVWSETMRCLGMLKPSGAGHEYAAVEQMESANHGLSGINLLRSTDAAVYRYSPKWQMEWPEFRLGPVGYSWTNNNFEGNWTCKVTIEAIETVIVPAGTFTNCFKFHKTVLEAPPGETAEWYEWVCPGFGMVKWVDHWVDAAENPPVTHNLSAWTLSAP